MTLYGRTDVPFVDSSGRGGLARWRGPYRIQVMPVVPPAVEAARAVRDGMTGRISVYVEATETDFDSAFLRLFDAADQPIPFSDDEPLWATSVTAEIRNNANLRFYALLDEPEDVRLRAARRVELVVRDRLGLSSEAVELPLEDPLTRSSGESCDPSGLVHLCEAPDVQCDGAPWSLCVDSPE